MKSKEDKARQSITIHPAPVKRLGKVRAVSVLVAPDKSMTHRSVMFAGIAKGKSVITSPLLGEDCRATIATMQNLGVSVELKGSRELIVQSSGMDGWKSPMLPLDFANSGTTTRLMLGLLSSLPGLFSTCFGDKSLSARPMGRVVELLRKMGAEISGRNGGDFLPLAVNGKSLLGRGLSSDKASAQVKSAVLLAGLRAKGETAIVLPKGGRDHTENFLKALGVKLSIEIDSKYERISLQGPAHELAARHYAIPGDPSSAAFFAAAAALRPGTEMKLPGILRNPTRIGFVEVLQRMGLTMNWSLSRANSDMIEEAGELRVHADHDALSGIDTDDLNPATFIDEVPVLAVVAAFANGQSRFRGLKELRVKESDRLVTTANLLKKAGAVVEIVGDDLIVGSEGRKGLTQAKAFTFDPEGDHRLAMAAAVMAKRAKGPCRVLQPQCVDVSFPGFFTKLEKV